MKSHYIHNNQNLIRQLTKQIPGIAAPHEAARPSQRFRKIMLCGKMEQFLETVS